MSTVRISAFLLIFVGILPAYGQESAAFLRSGFFSEITDTEAGFYKIYNLRMSANGERLVYTTSPESEFFVDGLRTMDIDGTEERILEQTPYPQAIESFDISDDGTKIVYARQLEFSSNERDLRLYNSTTQSDTLIVQEVPFLTFGLSNMATLQIFTSNRYFKLSGDGNWVFFVNRFGPIGSGNDPMEASGQTLYRVNTSTGELLRFFPSPTWTVFLGFRRRPWSC
jgi:hypothetical protein